MGVFAWACIMVGILLAIAAFIITANTTMNPWPTLVAGFCLTALGIVGLAVQRNLKP